MSENPIFSYTQRDYEGSRKEGLARIPILSGGQWTDLNATDPGIIILDYVHALVDMINYYQDHQALESFITTAKERANIFRLAKQLSYDIRSAKGAICGVTFNSTNTYDHIIKIPKYTSLSTNTGIKYVTIEDAYLPANQNQIVVKCEQGVIQTRTYVGTNISRFSNVSNADNQSILLTQSNIDIDTILITDNLGRVWTPVDYIVFSTEKDRVYQIDLNPDDTVTIKFGDGERGVVPRESDTLTIKYLITQAEDGRIGADSIKILEDPIYDDDGRYIEFLVSNNQSSIGGSSIQSSRSIREVAPGAIKAQGRAVTLKDFENLAKTVEGVIDARAYDINTAPDICLHHEVKVLILPEDVRGDTKLITQRVYNFLSKRMIPPTNLQILTPTLNTIDITVTIKKLDNAISDRLSYVVQQTIIDYFDNREAPLGEGFYPSDLSAKLSLVEGVRYVISMTPSSPVQVSDLAIVMLGKVTVNVQ